MPVFRLLLFAGALAVVGCAASKPAIDPRGSYPDLGTGNVSPSAKGALLVHTETFPSMDGDVLRNLHSGYDAYDPQGQWLFFVPNHRHSSDESPDPVDLAPGRYLIRPEAGGSPRRTFWVTIQEGKTTEVDVAKLPAPQ